MKTQRKGSFQEFTYTDGEVEVMLNVDAVSGKTLRIYIYARDVADLESCREGKTPYRWEPGLNPLFVHLPARSIRRFEAEFIDSGELVCTEREAIA